LFEGNYLKLDYNGEIWQKADPIVALR